MYMKNIEIEFTEEELQALAQLIDIAVKSQGMGVAEAAVVLVNKIRASVTPEQSVDSNPEFAQEIKPLEDPEVEEE
jgi:hypothetical protein